MLQKPNSPMQNAQLPLKASWLRGRAGLQGLACGSPVYICAHCMPGRPAPAGEEPYEAALGCGVPLPPTLGDAQGHQDEQPGV